MLRIYLRWLLVVVPASLPFSISSCTTTPGKDSIVENSLGDLGKRPEWTFDGTFQKYLKEIDEKDRKEYLHLVGRYNVKTRGDLDLCYKYARLDVETEISSSVGQAVSALVSQAISAGNLQTDAGNRVQEAASGSKTTMAIVGLNVQEKFWQQVAQAGDQGNTYECFVLARMSAATYKDQIKISLQKLKGVSEDQRKILDKTAEELDDVNEVFKK